MLAQSLFFEIGKELICFKHFSNSSGHLQPAEKRFAEAKRAASAVTFGSTATSAQYCAAELNAILVAPWLPRAVQLPLPRCFGLETRSANAQTEFIEIHAVCSAQPNRL
jgi:hypothetical protein